MLFTVIKFKNKFNIRYPGLLKENELTEYQFRLLKITTDSIQGISKGSLDYSEKLINQLVEFQKINLNKIKDEYEISNTISILIIQMKFSLILLSQRNSSLP